MEENISGITDAIFESYRLAGRINNTDGSILPSKEVVGHVCESLLELLFPGVYGDEPIYSPHLRDVTAHRLCGAATKLTIELRKSNQITNPLSSATEIEQAVLRCLKKLPEVRELLETDIEAAFGGDPAAAGQDEVIVAYPFLETVAIQRVAHLFYMENLALVPRIMTEWAHSRTGIDISPGTEIGSHFFIDHGTGVVIGETSKIGEKVGTDFCSGTDINPGAAVRPFRHDPWNERQIFHIEKMRDALDRYGFEERIGHNNLILPRRRRVTPKRRPNISFKQFANFRQLLQAPQHRLLNFSRRTEKVRDLVALPEFNSQLGRSPAQSMCGHISQVRRVNRFVTIDSGKKELQKAFANMPNHFL